MICIFISISTFASKHTVNFSSYTFICSMYFHQFLHHIPTVFDSPLEIEISQLYTLPFSPSVSALCTRSFYFLSLRISISSASAVSILSLYFNWGILFSVKEMLSFFVFILPVIILDVHFRHSFPNEWKEFVQCQDY